MTKKVTGALNYQGYNNYITEIQPDRVEMEFFGQSEKIPPEHALYDDVFVTSSAALPYVEPPMSFKTSLSAFQFQNATIPIKCHDQQCAADLQRYLHTNDSNFQLSMLLKFYKSDVLLKSMNLVVNQPTDSCFDSARGVLDGNKLNILTERNAKSANCSLVLGQKVDLAVNLTRVDKVTNQTSTQQLVLQNVDFRYNMSVQLNQFAVAYHLLTLKYEWQNLFTLPQNDQALFNYHTAVKTKFMLVHFLIFLEIRKQCNILYQWEINVESVKQPNLSYPILVIKVKNITQFLTIFHILVLYIKRKYIMILTFLIYGKSTYLFQFKLHKHINYYNIQSFIVQILRPDYNLRIILIVSSINQIKSLIEVKNFKIMFMNYFKQQIITDKCNYYKYLILYILIQFIIQYYNFAILFILIIYLISLFGQYQDYYSQYQ
ncbi:Hypothetical_protein [Hexamita inflata]|uniref:Hypothetical_protein n=1 Tax=Hexamita inflata TaxID=28002 RepID=A0AA86TNL5_9EUKA|nr:Hypothetical protein HINF_LOCUS10515 [Hexamita inflata]